MLSLSAALAILDSNWRSGHRHFAQAYPYVNISLCGSQKALIPRKEKMSHEQKVEKITDEDLMKSALNEEALSSVVADHHGKKLKEKAKYVQWNNENRKEHFCIIAKSF